MITPIDIRKLEFSKSFRGYNPEEVRAALESIAKELEKQVKDNTSLKERLNLSDEKLKHFKMIEKTLQDSVLTMQTTLEEKRKAAEQEAQLIIQEAKLNASGEYKQYKEQINHLRSEIYTLESQKSKYFIRFKNFLRSQLDWLNTMEQEEGLTSTEESLDFKTATKPSQPETSQFPTTKRVS